MTAHQIVRRHGVAVAPAALALGAVMLGGVILLH